MAYKASDKNKIEKTKHSEVKNITDINSFVTEAGGYSFSPEEKEKFNREYRHMVYAVSKTWINNNILP